MIGGDIDVIFQLLGGGVSEVEVCPDGLVLMEEISRRIKTEGGGALIADYGDKEISSFTFRVINESIPHYY